MLEEKIETNVLSEEMYSTVRQTKRKEREKKR